MKVSAVPVGGSSEYISDSLFHAFILNTIWSVSNTPSIIMSQYPPSEKRKKIGCQKKNSLLLSTYVWVGFARQMIVRNIDDHLTIMITPSNQRVRDDGRMMLP